MEMSSFDENVAMMPTIVMILMRRFKVDSVTITEKDIENAQCIKGMYISSYDPAKGGRTISLEYTEDTN